jgi:hypothetical protein
MTQSPGMSELRAFVRDVELLGRFPLAIHDAVPVAAAVSTLLDDLAAAQGEIERLREALKPFADIKSAYVEHPGTRDDWKIGPSVSVGDVRRARSALTLKSEKADTAVHLAHCGQGEYATSCKYGQDAICPALTDLKPTPVASEPKNSDVQQVKP